MPEEAGKPPQTEARPDRALPIHPVCLAIFPILSVYSANLAIVPIEDLWRPLGVAVACAIGVTAVFWPVFRDLHRAATSASIVLLTSFLYSSLSHHVGYLANPIGWAIAIIGIALVGGLKVKRTAFLNVLSGLLVVVATGNIAYGHLRITLDESRIRHSIGQHTGTVAGKMPDIFYVILDGYGRSDMLKKVIGFDNSPFIDGLKKRGFYLADQSHSNYVQTEISLSSSLNLSLIPDLLPNMSRETTDRTPFDGLISGNELSRYLRDRGYRTIAITSGFPPVQFPNADLWLTHASSLSLFETTILQMTPLVPQDQGITSQFSWRYDTLKAAFKNLHELAAPSDRPRFVFVHILAPHPPFVLNADGTFHRPRGPFGYWDGSDYMMYCGKPLDYAKGYAAQAEAIDNLVLPAVDDLLGKSATKPIIVIQGDHGSKKLLDQNELGKTDVTECFKNLEAFYVPDSIRPHLYPGITPVNEFRVILNGLFGENLPLLPDHSWYSPFGTPLEFTDVTAKVLGPAN